MVSHVHDGTNRCLLWTKCVLPGPHLSASHILHPPLPCSSPHTWIPPTEDVSRWAEDRQLSLFFMQLQPKYDMWHHLSVLLWQHSIFILLSISDESIRISLFLIYFTTWNECITPPLDVTCCQMLKLRGNTWSSCSQLLPSVVFSSRCTLSSSDIHKHSSGGHEGAETRRCMRRASSYRQISGE